MSTKVACPKCRAKLKSARELAPGRHVTCPRCKSAFVVPGVEIAKGAPAMGVLEPASQSMRTPASSHTADSPITAADPAEFTLETTSRGATWLLVALGSLLVLGGGALLIYFCFLGDSKKTDERAEEFFQLPDPQFKPLPPRPLIPLSQAEQKQVDTAVNRGVAFLKKTQNAEGTWACPRPVEAAALAGMTLLECGVPANDPVIVKAANYVRKQVPNMHNTYGLSLYVLFLNKLNDREDKDRIKELVMRLVMGQTLLGGWSYQCPTLSAKDQEILVSLLNDMGNKSVPEIQKTFTGRIKALPLALQRLPLLHPLKKGANYRAGGDNSNTQFALLALWAARSQKLPVDPTLRLVVERFRNSQNPDGSWFYAGNSIASPGRLPTMTCAGLLALAVGYGLPAEKRRTDPLKDQAIDKALKHVAKSIGGRDQRGKPRMLELYFLWSVERVGVLYHLKEIAGKEWYYWGMDILLPNQHPNGGWLAGIGHGSDLTLDTCFALLFLQRANLAQDLTDKLRELLDHQAMLTPASQGRQPPPVGKS